MQLICKSALVNVENTFLCERGARANIVFAKLKSAKIP